jgi:hypothetical protein
MPKPTPAVEVIPAPQDLTAEEQEAVSLLLSASGQMDDAIPDDIDGPTLWFNLQSCCKALSAHRRNISTLKPLIGRMLIVLQNNPTIYQHYGFATFDAFVTNGLRDLMGVPRSEAYSAKRLAEHFPSLSIPECQAVGYGKLSFLSKFTSEEKPECNRWLALAQSNSLDVLKDIAANKGILPREESDFVTYTVVMNKGTREMIEAFVTDPSIQSYVGSDNPAKIIEMACAEAEATWRAHSMYKARAPA